MPEPAIRELEILSRYRTQLDAVIVDDFRSFGQREGFPRKSTLLDAGERLFGAQGFGLRVHLDMLILERKRSDGRKHGEV